MTNSYLLNEDGTFISLEAKTGWYIILEADDMADQVEIQIPKTRVTERSAFTATAYFRTRSTKEASLPTTVRYRIDDLTNRTTVKDWTTVTPGNSVEIAITAGDNAIVAGANKREQKQIMVQADYGTDTQVTNQTTYWVANLYGLT